MLDKFLFFLGEVKHLLINKGHLAWKYFIFITFDLFILAISFIIYVNINYFYEILSTRSLSYPLMSSLVPIVDILPVIKVFSILMIGMGISGIILLNYYYISNFLLAYKKEIKLVLKLKGEKSYYKIPLLILGIFINSLGAITSWIFIRDLYSFLMQNIVSTYINFSLLQFHYFKLTLLIILILLSFLSVAACEAFISWYYQRHGNL